MRAYALWIAALIFMIFGFGLVSIGASPKPGEYWIPASSICTSIGSVLLFFYFLRSGKANRRGDERAQMNYWALGLAALIALANIVLLACFVLRALFSH